MAAVKKATSAHALDVKALSAQLGATVKEGRVSTVRDRYYLTLGQKKLEIPVGDTVSIADIKKMVGRRVPVIVARSTIVAIGSPLGHGCYWIICYKPIPDILKQIGEAIRVDTIKEFVKTGVLTEVQAQTLKADRGAAEILRG